MTVVVGIDLGTTNSVIAGAILDVDGVLVDSLHFRGGGLRRCRN